MTNKKQTLVTISFIIILIVITIGISYAAFKYVGQGTRINQITTGTISMEYAESDNIISIDNALPTRDETGKIRMKENEYFDFSITTTLNGVAVINYEIAVEDLEDNTFDGTNVKYYLTKIEGDKEIAINPSLPKTYNEETINNDKTGRPAGMMSLYTGSTSTKGSETTRYRLRLYVDEKYNPQGDRGNLVFKTRVNVYGKVNPEEIPVSAWPMMKSYGSTPTGDFHTYAIRSKVTSITTKGNIMVPSTAINSWDVSAAGNKSIIAYIEDDGSGGYKATIGGKGGIMANTNSEYLFNTFPSLVTADLSYLNTSKVTNMRSMFASNSKLQSLNLKSFDTSNVTNMESMFHNCRVLTTLDLTSFNTVKVKNMKGMFRYCRELKTILVSNKWTTASATTSDMFYSCGAKVTVV